MSFKRKTQLALLFGVMIGISIVIYQEQERTSYDFFVDADEDWHIRLDDKIIVQPTILDYRLLTGYVVGIRLSARGVTCNYSPTMIVEKKKVYFILDKQSGINTEFDTRQAFEDQLQSLPLKKSINLDYDKFDAVWDRNSAQYAGFYSGCKDNEIMREY